MTTNQKPKRLFSIQKIEVDKIFIDLIAIDSTTGVPVGKPPLSILHDSITKEIVDSSVTIKTIVIDNGRELEASGLENISSKFGISISRYPHHKPQFKGLVERHFQKQNRVDFLEFCNPSKNQTDQVSSAIKKRGK